MVRKIGQCDDCKKYLENSEMFQVRTEPNLLLKTFFGNKTETKIICKDCLEHRNVR